MIGILYNSISDWLKRERFRLYAGVSRGVNTVGYGTHLAAILTVTNPGRYPIVFGGVEAEQEDGDIYFPMFQGLVGKEKIDARSYATLTIPAAHLLGSPLRRLSVLDGIGRRYSLRGRKLKRLLADLQAEKNRLSLYESE